MSLQDKAASLEREQQLKERLKSFIFDKNKVMPTVTFTQFQHGERFCMGFLLPKEKDIYDKEGNFIRKAQIQAPTVITNDAGIYNVQPEWKECLNLNVRFESIPAEMPLRWSLTGIESFLFNRAPAVEPKALYEKIKSEYAAYLYFGNGWYSIHALWDMGTYFHQGFHAYPYLELRGIRGSAKTKVMTLSGCLSFNATPVMVAPTPATLFRETHDKRPTTYLDEAENLFRVVKGKVEHDERIEVINSGYTREGAVPRMEARGKKYVQVVYRTYSPKMIGSINGLQGATESRSIVHITTRAPDHDKRGEKEIETHDPQWQTLRDELYLFAFQHHTAVLAAYTALLKDNPTALKKRDFQLWRPLLAVAKVVGDDVYAETVKFAEKQSRLKKFDEINEGSYEYAFLNHMYALLKGGASFVLLKELAAVAPGEKQPSSKTVARILDGLGLDQHKEHSNVGDGYRITREEFESILAPIAPAIFTSLPSFPSHSDEEIIIDVKNGEENAQKVKKENRVGEDGDSNEGGYALNTVELRKDYLGNCNFCGLSRWLRWSVNGHHACEECKRIEGGRSNESLSKGGGTYD